MKILLGKLKGRNFYMPRHIRPTQNVLKKAIFDIVGDVEGLDFLELYAGSGGVGFEALSLGAKTVTLIERDPDCIEAIHKNMEVLNISDQSGPPFFRLITSDVFSTVKQFAAQKRKFHLIFMDPPFEEGLARKTLNLLNTHDILHANCLMIIQVGKRERLSEVEGRLHLVRGKFYGASYLAIYEAKPE